MGRSNSGAILGKPRKFCKLASSFLVKSAPAPSRNSSRSAKIRSRSCSAPPFQTTSSIATRQQPLAKLLPTHAGLRLSCMLREAAAQQGEQRGILVLFEHHLAQQFLREHLLL